MTKLEVFAAYLPYEVQVMWHKGGTIFRSLSHRQCSEESIYDLSLLLRPLSALQTPMQHPVTGEEIPNPAEWIAEEMNTDRNLWHEYNVTDYLLDNGCYRSYYCRLIDRLALSLHFDLYNAIEEGWAVAI